ncbi:MAG: 4Fe-4S binding protein [Candidatus Lokiarchaeota archaeon]|nr:4Fe-4S binding protein [Candidatus Lokiarchaeota archaeon]
MPRERFIPTVINPNLCYLCGRCSRACRNEAIVIQGLNRRVDYRKCTGCLTCVQICPYNAIKVTYVIEGNTADIQVDAEKCIAASGCQECVDHCPVGMYAKLDGRIVVDKRIIEKCRACKECEAACPVNAVKVVQA